MANPEILTSSEVAVLFDVDRKTVARWAVAGKLPCFRTLGGHLRFHAKDIHRLFETKPD
ncbi:BldC family transcriptional regulator [Streptomyces sp. NPDC001774]